MGIDLEGLNKTNTEFQKYIDDQSKVMNEKATTAKKAMDEAITTFYREGKWDDAQPFAAGTYQHLTTVEKWSLDHVSEMINAIRGAVFGGSAPPAAANPENVPTKVGTGTTVPAQDSATTKAISVLKMADMDLLIASAAFDIIQGILTGFTVQANASIVSNYAQKEIAPGLSLFVTVMENQYHRSDFLTDTTIIQNFYIFDTRMSLKRAADIAKFNQMQSLIDQQVGFETQILKFDAKIAALDVNRDDYGTAVDKLQKTLDKLNKFVEDLKIKIDALKKAALAKRALHPDGRIDAA